MANNKVQLADGTTLIDLTDTTATASDVAIGKYFYTVAGVKTQGTASGGMVYETGTYTTSSDIARPSINFSGTYNDSPVLVAFYDATGTVHTTTNTNYVFVFFDSWKLFGQPYPYSSSAFRYETAHYVYRTNNTSSLSASAYVIANNSDDSGDSDVTYAKYWVTNTGFHPYSNSTSRYWRSGRTYKWIAVWKP